MQLLSMDKDRFHQSVSRMVEENLVYGVRGKSPGFGFARLYPEDQLRLDYDITVLPPITVWLPTQTTLLCYRLRPEFQAEAVVEVEPDILIGIHPYDLHAVKTLDAVYIGYGPDKNYQTRRAVHTVIGLDCLNPWPYAFAPSMGTALPPPGLFDLWLTDLGEEYLMEVGSEKGQKLARKYLKASLSGAAKAEQRDKVRAQAMARYKKSLDLSPQEVPAALDQGWNSPMWEELGRKCFSCGSCTMVCPTCVCFDVVDRNEIDQKSGERYRRWDSCMFDGFAEVATGENFRPTGTERLRHRLHRKGKYMLERWGQLGCVGCGRCIHACLVDIASPVYAWNRLAREAKEKRA